MVVELLPRAGPSPTIDRVVHVDASKILVAPESGQPYAIRLDDVSAFTRWRGGRGAAVGAVVGGAVLGFGLLVSAVVIAGMGDPGPSRPGEMTSDQRSGPSWGPIAEICLVSAAAGAAVGALIGAGTRRSFMLVPDAAPEPPPRPSLSEHARVVASSAELRSAPFEVAPVIAVLPRGQGLLVAATANAGWRVAALPDGRVGYIQDANVTMDGLRDPRN